MWLILDFFLQQIQQVEGNEADQQSNVEEIPIEGTVVQAFPNARFSVELPNGHTILAHVSGKIRRHFIFLFARFLLLQ